MSDTGTLNVDRLFKGLTRPAKILGVSFPYAILNAALSMVIFVATKNLIILVFVLPALHGLGYAICFHEPLFVELFLVKLQKFNECKNRLYHRGNSYDAT